MNQPDRPLPERLARMAGPLPEPGAVPDAAASPYETVQPVQEGFIERDGVRLWYATWGESGPWIAFAPPFQIVHSQMLKGTVPYLSRHFRVITMDGRGNGRSDRPEGQAAYSFDHFHADFVAVLDAVGVERVALVGISAAALTVLRLAAEQPQRITHVVTAGGFAESLTDDPKVAQRLAKEAEAMRGDWPAYVDWFMATIFSEPHSTKPYEDGVHYAWATRAQWLAWCRNAWMGNDVRELARRVACPTLVIHGDEDGRVPYAKGREIHALVPGSDMLTIGGGGHVTAARDPVVFNRTLREFIGGTARQRTWTRAMKRPRRALFISSPIGLGHVQRDLAIARELRKLQPDLAIDWFTTDPAAGYLEREGEHLHPITRRLANESRHFERMAGEHDLSAFFALRTMDEVMNSNFMTFLDLVESEHYDIVVGDEAWDVDYHYHENPELKRQPYVFLTDFVGCLPMEEGNEREAVLCADRNADDIEHVARYPYLRDAAIFVGNREDVTEQAFGPGLPGIREWTDRNFCYCGYCLPFDPAALADTQRLRARLGYRSDEKIAIAAVGGTATGQHLLQRIAQAFPRMKRELPELRLILVTGPRLSTDAFEPQPGLEVRPYVHNLFEHLACCDLALVQGGLSTTMELVATRRPFLSFPLQHHFEQCVHVRQRLANYAADRSMDYTATLDPDALARRALAAMHEPVRYRPVETDGAARAALRIAQVLENRGWAR
ncbi:alpha/beta fold hydrolase [Variovorax sp. OV329]|uniref:alpha/beta fold hydrolase n=1 Tax=Variovorax sp. OV329 TaxID=1882825 RepID=UPI0008E46D7F|nr:alpha/beta fold hydrolase [Variovorax sp. OV329]SFN15367.1 Pimeloyl-ACP methyl ester carboxylesterase [Variovorax sp. OV329]